MKTKQNYVNRFVTYDFTVTICAFLFIMFVKNFVNDHYLINFSIDLIVGVFGFVMMVMNLNNIHRLLKESKSHSTPLTVEIVTIVVALAVTVITCKSPFDISFLILVIGMIACKKNYEKELF